MSWGERSDFVVIFGGCFLILGFSSFFWAVRFFFFSLARVGF